MLLRRSAARGCAFPTPQRQSAQDLEIQTPEQAKAAAYHERAEDLKRAVQRTPGGELDDPTDRIASSLLAADPGEKDLAFGDAASVLSAVEAQIADADQLRADVGADPDLRYWWELDVEPLTLAEDNFADAEDRAGHLEETATGIVGVGPGPAGPTLSAADATLDWATALTDGVFLAAGARAWALALDPAEPPAPEDVEAFQSRFLDGADAELGVYLLRVVAAVPGLHPGVVPRLTTGTTLFEEEGAQDVAVEGITALAGEEQQESVALAWEEDPELVTDVAELDRIAPEGTDAAPFDDAMSHLCDVLGRDTLPGAFPMLTGSPASAALSATIRAMSLLRDVQRQNEEVAALLDKASKAPLGGSNLRDAALGVLDANKALALPSVWSTARGFVVSLMRQGAARGADPTLAGLLEGSLLTIDDEVVEAGADNPDRALLLGEKLASDPDAAAQAAMVAEIREAAALVLKVQLEAKNVNGAGLASAAANTASPMAGSAGPALALAAVAVDVGDLIGIFGAEPSAEEGGAPDPDEAIIKAVSLVNSGAQGLFSLGEALDVGGLGQEMKAWSAHVEKNAGKYVPATGWSAGISQGLSVLSVGLSIASTHQAAQKYFDGDQTDASELLTTIGGGLAGAVGLANPVAGALLGGFVVALGALHQWLRKLELQLEAEVFEDVFDELDPHLFEVTTQSQALKITAGRLGALMSKERTVAESKALDGQIEAFRERGTGVLTGLGSLRAAGHELLAMPDPSSTAHRDPSRQTSEYASHAKRDERYALLLQAFENRMGQLEPERAIAALVTLKLAGPDELLEVVPDLELAVTDATDALEDTSLVARGILEDKSQRVIVNELHEVDRNRRKQRGG
jgi:hypothetical protein